MENVSFETLIDELKRLNVGKKIWTSRRIKTSNSFWKCAVSRIRWKEKNNRNKIDYSTTNKKFFLLDSLEKLDSCSHVLLLATLVLNKKISQQ